jgi:hypothetical protein
MEAEAGRIADMAKTIHTLEKKIEVLQEQKDMMSDEKACFIENARQAWKSLEENRAALIKSEERTERLLAVIELMAGGVQVQKRAINTQTKQGAEGC